MESLIRYFQPPKKSYFLFGPRGTGKSTWAKQFYQSAAILDLLDPESYRLYKAAPERLNDFIQTYQKNTTTFIIDEVQKSPELLSVVHQLIERNKKYQFVLTGSSARKLKRSGVDLLGGRAQLKTMHPFMPSELGDQFCLKTAMQLGLLPLIQNSVDPVGDLKAYITLYMKEEVQQEGLVRNIDQFARFLEAISFSQASVINFTNIAQECSVSSKTIENYVGILEDLLLSFRLPVFTKKAKRRLATTPKFYYFDAGVYVSVRPKGPMDDVSAMHSPVLETIVAQTLRAWIDYSTKEGKLFFWRSKSGLEVDFIVYGEIGFYAIEVKNTSRLHREDLNGLIEFKKDYPNAECILLCHCKEKMRNDHNILCYPIESFLKAIKPNQSLPA
ncbi:MAG: ATPase [Gammaproteobacteria bacterium RIFCSPHIGHO2_12_FULL_38_11]|nr:MAG: ATPase [Gammaproteobacteria bacterium RIFCSPHIGHO2_12_FULL_38_11]